MRILVTGGTGSVGEPIVRGLLDAGHDVVAYAASPPSDPTEVPYAQGDTLDEARLSDVIEEVQPETLIHAAAVTPNPETEADAPDEVLEVNVVGALRALRAFARRSRGRFLYVSSIAAYGDAVEVQSSLREDIDGHPRTLYELSKQSAERAVLRAGALRHIEVACLRLGDVFGPGERATRFRSTMSGPFQVTALAAAGQPIRLPEEGLREWTYTRDVATAVLTVTETRCPLPAVINVGSGTAWSLMDWCAHLQRVWPALRVDVEPATANVTLFSRNPPLDGDRLANLGFQAEWGLDRAFEDYMGWWDDRCRDDEPNG